MITEKQKELISQQLGRPARGIERVAVSINDNPVVLQMRSFVGGQPFPTLYWLCSKSLHKAIADIETVGWVKKIEKNLQEDDALLNAYLLDQKKYIENRWQAMRPEDKNALEELGLLDMFLQVGIGGLANHQQVRCLHMQYAHHLAEGNIIGKLLEDQFPSLLAQ